MIQLRTIIISTLLFAFQIHSAFIEERVPHALFLRPLLVETSAEKIIDIYRKELSQLFDYKLRSVNSILHMLQEISTLNPAKLSTSFKSLSQEELQTRMIEFLAKHSDLKDIPRFFRDFLQNVFNFIVAASAFSKINLDQVLEPKVIQSIVDSFETQTRYKFGRDEKKKNLINELVSTRNNFFQGKVLPYANFIEFFNTPHQIVADIIFPMTVFYLKENKESKAQISSKTAKLSEFVVEKNGYEYLEHFAKHLIDAAESDSALDKAQLILIVADILEIFLRANTNSDVTFGKRIFLYYFSTDYGKPLPEEYKQFLLTKYKQERLKFSIATVKTNYPELLRLYTLDVLDASLTIEEDFISPEDTRFIFLNFQYFLPRFNKNLIPYMRSMRALFTQNRHLLSPYYELFNGLYDTLLLSGPYLGSSFFGQNWENPGELFNQVLDKLLNWENSYFSYVWAWQPSSKHFQMHIQTNYFFYKLVNLVTFFDQLKTNDFSFLKFKEKNDNLIHKFTLEPEYKRLVLGLKEELLLNKGFNYQRFSALKIPSKTLLKYDSDNQKRMAVLQGLLG